MRDNSKAGGSSTNLSGLSFEDEVFSKLDIDFILENEIELYPKHSLYRWLNEIDSTINIKEIVSKKLLPDNAFYSARHNVLHIIEVKNQLRSGSVDEKIQTCGFKLRQYNKILSYFIPNIKIKFSYILSDWFKRDEYLDSLEYIEECNCNFYFNSIPKEELIA